MTFLQRHAYGIGSGFAKMLWPLFRKRRRIAVENLLRGGIAADETEARRIARASFAHFAGHIAEALCVPYVITAENWREHIDTTTDADPELAKLILERPDIPILMVSSHHGVWEAATNLLSFARPMYAIARVMNNKLVAKWMKNHHFRGPVTVIDKNHGFTPDVLKGWQEDKAAMTILMDQYTHNGARLYFMGRPARTFTSATRLAMRTGYPIAVGSFVRVAPYQYRMVGGAPLVFSKGDDRDKCTQLLNDRLEAAIRKYPEQYLWVHRRWRDD